MTDYIKREDALEAVNSCGICIQKIVDIPAADVVERELYQRALSDVVRLSVERPERKHGEWFDATTLDNEFICWVCSECRHGADFVDEPYNYCPNCGARMKGGAE